jgi:hypothetical protein
MHVRTWKSSFALLSCLGCIFCVAARGQNVPHYKVDPSWPKELPNNWILSHIEGVAVDSDDHIWVLHQTRTLPADDGGAAQTPPLSECCVPAPSVMEFDENGNVLQAWGGPGYVPDWPAASQGITVDKQGNVWIGGVYAPVNLFVPPGERPKNAQLWDRQVLKFSNTGKLLLEIGHPGNTPTNNQDPSILGGPCAIKVDDKAHEVYIADGHLNKRVVVYDSDTGAFKRGWGAYGIPLSDIDNSRIWSYDPAAPPYNPTAPPSKQFRGPLADMTLSEDGLLYVCDRNNDRIQVFTKQGKFVKEFFVAPKTLDQGSTWGVALSRDPGQKFLFVGDGGSSVIRILNRNDGTEVTTVSHKGRNAGQLDKASWLAVDSHGDLFTGEIHYNNRVQKFILEK